MMVIYKCMYFIIYEVPVVAAFMIITATRMIEESMDLMACVITTAELAKSIALNITAHSNITDTASGCVTCVCACECS